MFLAAVARPRYDYSTGNGFDGKVGIFPMVTERLAQRTTNNQAKGDVITVPLAVDKQVYYNCLKDQVFPAIMRKWKGKRSHVESSAVLTDACH
jgi:hypothetical protein